MKQRSNILEHLDEPEITVDPHTLPCFQELHLTTVFSLIGMALVWEYGYTGRQVQMAHMQLVRRKFE
jgi:hypothetical protein